MEDENDLLSRMEILSIPYGEVLESIVSLHKIESIVGRKGLPQGYLVKNVQYNYSRQTFDFLIVHESFGIVMPGAVIPQYDDVLITQLYKVEVVR